MKKVLLLLLCFAGFSAIAQRRHPIDVAFNKCTVAYQNDPDFMGEPGPGRGCDGEALENWQKEMERLLVKMHMSSKSGLQGAWVRHINQHVTQMKTEAKEATGLKRSASDNELSMDTLDEIRGYRIGVTRKRVLELTKLAKEQPFIIPKE